MTFENNSSIISLVIKVNSPSHGIFWMPGQDERNVEWIPVGGEGFLSSKDSRLVTRESMKKKTNHKTKMNVEKIIDSWIYYFWRPLKDRYKIISKTSKQSRHY